MAYLRRVVVAMLVQALFPFLALATPSITSLTPNSGTPGTSITIAGSGFSSTTGTVAFNSVSATTSGWTDTSISAIVPVGATSGNVVVTAGGVQSNGVNFTVLMPTITGLNPSGAPVGAAVTISGSNFGISTGTVTFGGQAASTSVWTDSSIQATVPAGAVSGNIVVTTPGGVASNGFNFTVIGNAFPGPITYAYDELGRLVGATAASGDAVQYNYDAVGNILSITRYSSSQLALFSFSPKSGPVGTQVAINGANFSSTVSQDSVSFNGTAATITSATATQLIVSVPTGATTGPITVTAPPGSATSSGTFTVLPSSGVPTISAFTPAIATPGAAIAITGTNFDLTPQNDRLVLNITPAVSPTSPAPTSTAMTMTLPSLAGSGHISLATPGGTAVSSGDLYVPPSSYASATVVYNARVGFNNPVTVTIPNSSSIALLLFDGIAGHAVSISAAPVAGSSYTVGIYRPDNSPLSGTTSCSTSCFIDSQRLPVSGTYALLVASGNATVTLYDSTVITQSITPGGAAVTVTPGPGQNARLTFNATSGQQATVQLTGNTISSVTVSLLNPDGSTLISTTSSASSFSLPTVMLPQTGQQVILIDPPGGNTGSITASVVVQGNPLPPPSRPVGAQLDPSSPVYANLVGLFAMNEGTGTTDVNLVDGKAATFSGSGLPTWYPSDPSIVFNGGAAKNSYLDTGVDSNLDQLPVNKMTVVAKVYVNGITAGGIAENTVSYGFSFMFDSTGSLHFLVYKSGGALYVATAANAIAPGQWVQVAATWDGTVGNAASAHLFVNGVEQTKATSSDPGGTVMNVTGQSLRIGTTSFFAPSSLNGRMAYLAVYRGQMLTPTQMNQLDSKFPTTTDVLGTITETGGPVTQTTTVPGQGVQLTFQGWTGQQVTVQLSNNTMGAVTANLVNPDGTVLTTASSSAGNFNLPAGTLPSNGQYDVVVHPTGATTGSITVNLSVQGGLRPSGATIDTSNPLSTSLVGLFIMNEGSGTTDKNLADGNTASFSGSGAPTWNTVDPSIVFNGGAAKNSYLNAGSDTIFDQLPPSKMTVVAKVYVTGWPGGIVENTVSAGLSFMFDSLGSLHFLVVKSGGDLYVGSANSAVPTGQWAQLAVTWDGTVGTAASVHLYLNGVELSKPVSSDPGGTPANATSQPFLIGTTSFFAPSSFSGKMLYLAVYKGRILTTTEMGQLDAQLPIH